jgi:hypothetical protein
MPYGGGSRPSKAFRHFLGSTLLLVGSVVVGLGLSEGFFTLLLARPRLLRGMPAGTVSHLRRLYLAHDRNLIQAMPCCAQFDPQLFYTLRPGRFHFENREFDDEFDVNTLGLRDAEGALHDPELVVLGDSYAMGWGVPQDETMARLIQRETGLRALNAGIAGYGTVREMRLLDRIETATLRYLVIQYCDDDILETRPFANHDDVLEVRDQRQYRQDVRRAERRKRYWLGRRTYEFLHDVFFPTPEPEFRHASPEEHARYFVNALLHAGRTDLSRVRLVTFEILQTRTVDGVFALALRREIASEKYPPWVRDMIVLDLTGRLGPEHYYDLDDHLRPEGQKIVAAAVSEAIRRESAP